MSHISSPAVPSSPTGEISEPSNTDLGEKKNSDILRTLGDGTEDEASLERRGEINALQRHRYKMFSLNIKSKEKIDTSIGLLRTEESLREVVQEEISIRESDTRDSTTTKRLQFLRAEYQVLAHEWWYCRSNLAPTGQLQAFELWRSHPQWYMHSELVKDCAGRQGCCARKCGCCLNRKIDASRSLGKGHCTFNCGCCAKSRGFEFSEQQKVHLKKLYKLDWASHYRTAWIWNVSIWGLTADSWANPFDMIIAPPTYEQSEANKMPELTEKMEAIP